ncbi:hypothetical protein NMG60_11023210 [Bertholletia excelsa]
MEMETGHSQPCCYGGAEAVFDLQPNSSLPIAYHPQFGPHNDLVLLELDEKFLPDVINERVTLRGQPDEDAVLCTATRTYAIKFVGTSNSVLLVPPSDHPAFCGNARDFDEKDVDKKLVAPVIKVAPGTMELVENPYNFDEALKMDGLDHTDKNKYTWDDLVSMVQASDEELRSGLQALSAVEIDGYWRIVDAKYMDGILNMLLHNSVLNEWSLKALNESEVIGVLELDGFPCKMACHCLQVYCCKVDDGVWRLDDRRVCVHFAREILKAGKLRLENFLAEWMRKIPEGMQASFDMLEGEVLTEKIGIETWVYAFSVSSLPSTPGERFLKLFQERPRWEGKDLQPYIRSTCTGAIFEGLLLKYTRRTQPTPDAEPIFSAR